MFSSAASSIRLSTAPASQEAFPCAAPIADNKRSSLKERLLGLWAYLSPPAEAASISVAESLELAAPSNPLPQGVIDQFSAPCELLMSHLLAYDTTRELYERACRLSTHNLFGSLQTTPWKIQLIAATPCEGSSFALCEFTKRTIALQQDLSFELALSYLIFELINATHYEEHQRAYAAMLASSKDQEAYVRECESIEHRACREHHVIIQKAISTLGWPAAMDIYGNQPTDFELAWEGLKASPHAHYYRAVHSRASSSGIVARALCDIAAPFAARAPSQLPDRK